MIRPRIALYWAGSCGGCEIAVLEIHEKIIELVDAADIVFWPCVMDIKYDDVRRLPDGAIDVCLFNGVVENEENVELAHLLRRKSRALVAFGACAGMGGIPGLRNLHGVDEVMRCVYSTTASTENPDDVRPRNGTSPRPGVALSLPALLPRALPLDRIVAVDHRIPGCPPEAPQVVAVCQAILAGALPPPGAVLGAGDRCVCDGCPTPRKEGKVARFRRPYEGLPDGKTCLLEQGFVCMGPVTRSGCESRCPSVNMPCRGCYGPAGATIDQGAKMIALLGSIVEGEDEASIRAAVDGVVDPVGTFYRHGLPGSLLKGAKR